MDKKEKQTLQKLALGIESLREILNKGSPPSSLALKFNPKETFTTRIHEAHEVFMECDVGDEEGPLEKLQIPLGIIVQALLEQNN